MLASRAVPVLSELLLKTTVPPMLVGERGMGKSAIYQAVVEEMTRRLQADGALDEGESVELRYVHLAQLADAGDLLGLPVVEDGQTRFKHMELFVTDEDVALGKASRYGVLVFDEPNRATRELIQVLFELLVNRRMGPHKLADGWKIGLAANPDTGDYIVNALDEAFWDRVCVLRFENDPLGWVKYARGKKLHRNVVDFVAEQADKLRGMMGSDWALPVKVSYRSLEMGAQILANCHLEPQDEEEVLMGVWGVEWAAAYTSWKQHNERRPLTAEDVLIHWNEAAAERWTHWCQSGEADLRNATIEAVKEAFDGLDPEENPWDGRWNDAFFSAWLEVMPKDVLAVVVSDLLKRSKEGGPGQRAATLYMQDPTYSGQALAKKLVQEMMGS